ncbi:MAG: hypothetical protein ACLR06_04950 [Christensenellaceae bacterium]
MIKVIYGAKGTGKTKQMIDAANAAVATAKGHLIFITDTKRGMYDLAREIRFIDVTDFDVAGKRRCAASSRALSRAITTTSTYISTASCASRANPPRSLRDFSICSIRLRTKTASPLRFPFPPRKKIFPIL